MADMYKDTFYLTTHDNPFDPSVSFDEWASWDQAHGYHSMSLLARVVATSSELSDEMQNYAINEAIQEIVDQNVSGRHTMVVVSGAG